MSEIPDDVMAKATAVWEETRFSTSSNPMTFINPVARAILAERERCAKIAEDDDGHFTWSGADKNAAMLQTCAREIAAAIRTPTH